MVDKHEGERKIWDNFHVIGEVMKTQKTKLVLGVGAIDGVYFLNVREMYFRIRDGAWQYGKAGVVVPFTLPVENGTKLIYPLQSFLDIVSEAIEFQKTMPMSDPANEVWIPKPGKAGKDNGEVWP